MWKVKLDDDVWLADGAVTTEEDKARLFYDIPSAQVHLKNVRRFVPYKEAMVIYDDEAQPISE